MARERQHKPKPNREVPIRWCKNVAEHDYAAVQAYLSLKLDQPAAAKAVTRLRQAKLSGRRANDILRGAGLVADIGGS